jgi:hypothetical protein
MTKQEQAARAQAERAAAQQREFERLQREGNSPLMSLEIMKGRGRS